MSCLGGPTTLTFEPSLFVFPSLRNNNDEIEGSFSNEDAEEDQFLTSKGKTKRRGFYSSNLFYLEFKMIKAILSNKLIAIEKFILVFSHLTLGLRD